MSSTCFSDASEMLPLPLPLPLAPCPCPCPCPSPLPLLALALALAPCFSIKKCCLGSHLWSHTCFLHVSKYVYIYVCFNILYIHSFLYNMIFPPNLFYICTYSAFIIRSIPISPYIPYIPYDSLSFDHLGESVGEIASISFLLNG